MAAKEGKVMKRNEVMTRARFVKDRGKLIYHLDFSKLSLEDIREVIAYGKGMIGKMPQDSLLSLTDVSETQFDDEAKDVMRELMEYNKPYVRAGAVVGVNGWRKLIYMVSLKLSGRNNLRLFDNVDAAMDWLASYG